MFWAEPVCQTPNLSVQIERLARLLDAMTGLKEDSVARVARLNQAVPRSNDPVADRMAVDA